MHLFYIPFIFIGVCYYLGIRYKAMIHNERYGTNWGTLDYMSKRYDFGIMFPIIRTSAGTEERRLLIRKYNRATAGFWISFVITLLVGALEFMP